MKRTKQPQQPHIPQKPTKPDSAGITKEPRPDLSHIAESLRPLAVPTIMLTQDPLARLYAAVGRSHRVGHPPGGAGQQPLINEPNEPEPNRSIFGLDLGQLQDFAAFVLVEKIVSHSLPQSQDLVAKPLRYYNVRGIERFPLGTSYPDIVKRVKQSLDVPKYAGAPVVIYGNGVGVPVVYMFRKIGMSARIMPVQIIAGQRRRSIRRRAGTRCPRSC